MALCYNHDCIITFIKFRQKVKKMLNLANNLKMFFDVLRGTVHKQGIFWKNFRYNLGWGQDHKFFPILFSICPDIQSSLFSKSNIFLLAQLCSEWGSTECIGFAEDQAFSPLYDLAPPPPLKTGILSHLTTIGLGFLVYQNIIKRKKVKIIIDNFTNFLSIL